MKADMTVAQAVILSLTNLTSAGQAAGIEIIAAGGTLLEIALTQFVINLRYALMGLSLSQKLDPSFGTPQRLLASYGIDATIHRHWTVPMNDNRVDVFLSYWEPGKMSPSVASEIIEFHNVSDTLLSRMRLYVEFRRFFRRLQSKLFSVTLSELTGPAGENLPRLPRRE